VKPARAVACGTMDEAVRKIPVSTKFEQYTVSVGSGILNCLSKRMRALSGKLIFVLTAPEIWSLWGPLLQDALEPHEPVVLFLPPGESHKRMAQIERLATEMTRAGADRSSMLIAFGGGVTGDVGGFLSAIYMRGIDYVQVPTTLLSQVDSSVGGKTGVNLLTGKNLVGCFYPPQEVVVDIELLRTLPQRELRAGVYEIIKAGLIRDASLFRYLESHRELIDGRDPTALEKIVAASIRMKAEVVTLDERELGLRMILNFGHTIGHAIEAATGYGALLHGEAVAWGMLVALHISRARQMVTEKEVTRIESLIRYFQPAALPKVSGKRLLQAASGDKKNRAGVRRFVLLQGIGNAVIVEDVADDEVLAAIEWTRQIGDRK
jgi:3-dehydroquinate synthase